MIGIEKIRKLYHLLHLKLLKANGIVLVHGKNEINKKKNYYAEFYRVV